MKRIRILMVPGAMSAGGLQNQLMHLLRNSDKARFQIDFTSTNSDDFYREEIESLGGSIHVIPPMNWKRPVPYCRAMMKIMREGQYDVVHSHELFHSGITLWLAKRAGVPCRFVHAHNWKDGIAKRRPLIRTLYNSFMRVMINRYSTVQIACSSWAGKFLYGKRMIRQDSYHLVFNSVDTREIIDHYFDREDGEYCETDSWKQVLNVARIDPSKNQMFLAEIAKEFKSRGDRIRILCVGTGNSDAIEKLSSVIAEEGLQEHLRLLGVRRDVPQLLRKCSAFVLPSIYEGMPLVMIEAQAAGLPCISADTYSPEVDFGIGSVKWLSLDRGAAAWADELEKAVNRPRADKAEVERAIQEKGFDSRQFTQKICALYEEDCSRRCLIK